MSARLTKVVLPDGKTITYTLDAFGRRVARKVNGTTTAQYLYSGGLNPVAELDGSGNLVSSFVYGEDATTPEYLIRSGHSYRYVTDQLGSVRALVDTADATIAEKLDHDPTGLLTQDTQPGFQPFGYAGGLGDPDTHLWHYGARDYDPTTLRWLAKDPLGFGGGDTNLYGYTVRDPVNGVDPTGEFCVGPICTPSKQQIVDAAAGFGDSLTLGGTREIRQVIGSDGTDYCSTAYQAGQYSGVVASYLVPGEGEVRAETNAARRLAKPTPKFRPPTNEPQMPPPFLPPGYDVRTMPPTEQYPNGYWVLSKNGSPVNPATGKPGPREDWHIPLPEGVYRR
jgi:RHS repeat-associated protein